VPALRSLRVPGIRGGGNPQALPPEVLARLSAAQRSHRVRSRLARRHRIADGRHAGRGWSCSPRGPAAANEPVASWPSKVVPEGALLAVVDGAVRGRSDGSAECRPRGRAPRMRAPYLPSATRSAWVEGRVRAALLACWWLPMARIPGPCIDRIAWGAAGSRRCCAGAPYRSAIASAPWWNCWPQACTTTASRRQPLQWRRSSPACSAASA